MASREGHRRFGGVRRRECGRYQVRYPRAGRQAEVRSADAPMGHDSVRAAIIYQHASGEADRAIADALSARVDAERQRAPDRTAGQDRQEGDRADGPAGALAAAG